MIKVEIILDKKNYMPSETVRGKIFLKTQTDFYLKSLYARFYKHQKIFLKTLDKKDPNILIDKNNIQKDTKCLISEKMQLCSGITIFPFNLRIKDDENTSGQAKGYFYDVVCQLENNFKLEVICDAENTVITRDKSIIVVKKAADGSFIDIKIGKSSFLFFTYNHLHYRIQMDKEIYFVGDNVEVNFFPMSKTSKSLISSIDVNLYEIAVFYIDNENFMRSKLISSFQAFPINRNRFKINMRLPLNIGPTMTNTEFSLRIEIYFNLNLYNGTRIKVKKNVSIGQMLLDIPEIEGEMYYRSNTYCEQVIDY